MGKTLLTHVGTQPRLWQTADGLRCRIALLRLRKGFWMCFIIIMIRGIINTIITIIIMINTSSINTIKPMQSVKCAQFMMS